MTAAVSPKNSPDLLAQLYEKVKATKPSIHNFDIHYLTTLKNLKNELIEFVNPKEISKFTKFQELFANFFESGQILLIYKEKEQLGEFFKHTTYFELLHSKYSLELNTEITGIVPYLNDVQLDIMVQFQKTVRDNI